MNDSTLARQVTYIVNTFHGDRELKLNLALPELSLLTEMNDSKLARQVNYIVNTFCGDRNCKLNIALPG